MPLPPWGRRRSSFYLGQCNVEILYICQTNLDDNLPYFVYSFWIHCMGLCTVWVTLTVVESCLLSGWSFISSLIHRPDHVSPLKESQGIDLYTCWLLLTCHSHGVAWHSLAHCCDMCSLTPRTAHLVVLKHCSFRLWMNRNGYGGLEGSDRANLLCWSLILVVNMKQDWIQWVWLSVVDFILIECNLWLLLLDFCLHLFMFILYMKCGRRVQNYFLCPAAKWLVNI